METEDQQTTAATSSDVEAPPKRFGTGLLASAKALSTRGLLANRSVRSALFAFTLSRCMVLAIFVVVGLMKTQPDEFPGHFDLYVSLDRAPIARVLRQEVLTADVNWYVGIAEHGYEQIPFNNDVPRNWAFFPLFPLLLHLASYLTGEFVLTGMALSHICFLLALFMLHRLSLLFGLSADDADRGLFYPVA